MEADGAALAVLRDAFDAQGTPALAASDRATALRLLDKHAETLDLVVCAAVPGAGLRPLVEAVRRRAPRAQVLVAAAPAGVPEALGCLSLGAEAVLRKPLEPLEVASVIATAAERASLRSSRAQAEALRAILGVASPQELAATIVSACKSALGADGAGLHLPGDGQNGLRAGPAEGACEREALVEAWLQLRIGSDRQPALLDPGLPVAEGAEWPRRVSTGPALVWPLMSGERLVGVFSAERNGRPFTQADVERLAPLAAQARLALDNVQLFGHLVASDRLASLGNLAASIAQELRTPLASGITSSAFLAEKLGAPEPQQPGALAGAALPLRELGEAAQESVGALNRIRDLVRDIGALTSPDETTRISLDLNEAVRAALRMAKVDLYGRARVVTRLGADASLVGSVGRLTQVFVTLLLNAAHTRSESGVERKIVVLTRRDGDRVIAEISDDGPGIPPAVLPRLFEPYFATKSAGKGPGLGLFLCRDIVRRHRGEIRVRSSPSYGTTFTIELPADGATSLRSEPAPSWKLEEAKVQGPSKDALRSSLFVDLGPGGKQPS